MSQYALPTLDKLQGTISPDLDPGKVASEWFKSFSASIEAGDVDGISKLFVEESYWRDILALTWDFRTFRGTDRIRRFLTDRLPSAHIKSLKLRPDTVGLQAPFSDLQWIQLMFDFETEVGLASGIIRLVPTANGEWKAHCVFTHLEDLKNFPEKIGALRNTEPNQGNWEEQRRQEAQFEGKDPVVLICGGGQSGLELAARLKCLGVPTLVIEKNQRIGDNWRNRYETLCLHDPVCEWRHFFLELFVSNFSAGYDHMAYLPYAECFSLLTF
jgi:hypothetical protein